MPWIVQEKFFSTETYLRSTKLFIVVNPVFAENFMSSLSRQGTHSQVGSKILREHETTLNLNAKGRGDTHSGRPRNSRSQVNSDAVRDSVGHSQYAVIAKSLAFLVST